MSKELPNINQQLTEEFGVYLEGGAKLNSIQDGLISVLTQFKEERFEPLADSGKDQVWAKIDQRVSAPVKIHRMERFSVLKTWTIAATVLIASFIGLYMVFMNQSPNVLIETYAEVEEITLQDGTEVTLRPNSRLMELSYSDSKQEYVIEGEAYFNVYKNTDRRFMVTAGRGMITVLGTRFNLSSWGEQTQVYLEEGSVRFENTNTSSSVTLIPGESASSLAQGSISLDKNANPDEFSDWRNNQLIFNTRKIQEIIDELEQHFNIVIQIPDEIDEVTLSGGLNLESPEQTLEYLALTLEGSFEKIADMEYRFIPSTD